MGEYRGNPPEVIAFERQRAGRDKDRPHCSRCGRAMYSVRAQIGVCTVCQPRRARTCRGCGRDISMYRRDFLCGVCRAEDRSRKPVAKPGCFTDAEWDGVPGVMPSLRAEYPRFSPCRDCEPSYRLNMARDGRCDLFHVSEDGQLLQLISDDQMRELMETDIEDPDD